MILYDSFVHDYQLIVDEYIDSFGEQPTDEQVWDFAYEIDRFDWDYMMERMKAYEQKKDVTAWIAVGSVRDWSRSGRGGFVATSWDKLIDRLRSDDNMQIEIDRFGRLQITTSDHDGGTSLQIKALTQRGYDLYHLWESGWWDEYAPKDFPRLNKKGVGEYSDEQIHALLFNSRTYSHNVGYNV